LSACSKKNLNFEEASSSPAAQEDAPIKGSEVWQEPSIPIKGLCITILGLRHKWWRFETMEDQVDWMDGKDIIAAFAALKNNAERTVMVELATLGKRILGEVCGLSAFSKSVAVG
jgi:riboflavin synthase alpha subunit